MVSEKIDQNPEDQGDGSLLENPPERASDMQLALFWATHIDNPCDPHHNEQYREALRQSYLVQAEQALSRIKEENARQFLQNKIREYRELGHIE